MTVIVDSREKRWDHIAAYFDRYGIEYEVRKLDVGDYMFEDGRISVDRKRSLGELSHNLMNPSDHARFWREVRRSRAQGIKLYILCEHGGRIKSIQDVAQWSDKYSGVSGRRLMDELYRLHVSYNIEFIFCAPHQTGMRIMDILLNGR